MILYNDLLEQALAALDVASPLREPRLVRWSRAWPCHLCTLEVGPDADGHVSEARPRIGRNTEPLRRFMTKCRPHWENSIGGRCAGDGPARCHPYLVEDIKQGRDSHIDIHQRHTRRITQQLATFERSRHWEHCGRDTSPDRAAPISAAGWCSGWLGLLNTVGHAE